MSITVKLQNQNDIEKIIDKPGTHFGSTFPSISRLSTDSFSYEHRQINIDTKVRQHHCEITSK